MPLKRARTHFFTRGVAVVLAILVCGSALDWGHLGGDDRDCSPALVHHDHAAHRFTTTPRPTSESDHCYICHSLRLLHVGLAARDERVVVAVAAAQTSDADRPILRSDFRVRVSPRAPPAAHL